MGQEPNDQRKVIAATMLKKKNKHKIQTKKTTQEQQVDQLHFKVWERNHKASPFGSHFQVRKGEVPWEQSTWIYKWSGT